MKRFYKTSLILATFLITITANAQEKLPFTFGAKGGMTYSKLAMDNVSNLDLNIQSGFMVGGTVDYDLSHYFRVQSGLELVSKNTKGSIGVNAYKPNLYYVQVPLHIAFKWNITDEFKLVFHTGPYASFGIFGKTTFGDNKPSSFGDDGLKRFDAGVGFGITPEIGNFFLDLSYDMGLLDIGQKGMEVKNRTGYLSVGYKFKSDW